MSVCRLWSFCALKSLQKQYLLAICMYCFIESSTMIAYIEVMFLVTLTKFWDHRGILVIKLEVALFCLWFFCILFLLALALGKNAMDCY